MDDPPPAPRSPLRLLVAGALGLAGLGWLLQGLGILTSVRSFMVGDPMWAVIGGACVVAGGALGIRELRRR